jgi:hypothetical protein
MKLSLRATVILAAIFAAICFGVAITGFTSLGGISDPTALADARGFAWFWTFLGSVASAFGLLAWWMSQRTHEGEDA